MRNYYWRCLKKAFSGWLGRADTVSGVITAVLAAISNIRPLWGGTVNTLLWAIPLAVFVVTIILGLVLSPYLVHREDEEKAEKVKKEKAELEKQLDNKERIRKIKQKLGIFLTQCQELKHKCVTEENPPVQFRDELAREMTSFLRENLGDEYIARINSSAGMSASDVVAKHPQIWLLCDLWEIHLNEFLSELKN